MEPLDDAGKDLLVRAAVRGTFDPVALVGGSPADQPDQIVLLAQHATEKQVNGRWLWVLTPPARRMALSRLPAEPAARKRFLAENAPDTDDMLGRMLHAALGSRSPPAPGRGARPKAETAAELEQRQAAEQVAMLEAVQALQEAGVRLPRWIDETTPLKLRRSITLTTRRQAARALLPEPFRGRRQERRFFVDYATRGIPAVEAARKRPFKTLWLADANKPAPPFPAVGLGGIGGSGKSALLSEVWKQLSSRRDITLVGFDFDQPKLRSGDPVALSLDFSRQIGILEPAVESKLVEQRDLLRTRLLQAGSGGTFERLGSELIDFLVALATSLVDAPRLRRPLVFVMDTFEELLIARAGRLDPLMEWLGFLRSYSGFHDIRLIISGRAIEALKTGENARSEVIACTSLGDLGQSAGEAKLRDVFGRYKVKHVDLAPRAVAAFGSNPLVLEILARFCAGKRRRTVEKLIEAGEKDAESGLQGEVAQRFLYSRILERIGDKALRDVASPGLVLRRITVTLIREILAGRCALPPDLSEQQARDILDRLVNQIWLVDRVGRDEVIHRRDLRRLMLPQILRQPGSVEIARAAAAWYDTHPSEPNARLESLYYRGLAGEDLAELDRPVLRELAGALGADVDDLPIGLRARVKNAAGGQKLTEAEVAALPAVDRQKIIARRHRSNISAGLESVVLESFGEFPGAPPVDARIDEANFSLEGSDAIALQHSGKPGDTGGLESLGGDDGGHDPRSVGQIEAPAEAPSPQAADVPLIEARFNSGQFDAVGMLAVVQFNDAIALLEIGSPKRTFELNNPAYLTAIAALLGNPASLQREIDVFMRDHANLERLRKLAAGLMDDAVDALGPLPAVILAARTVGIDPWPLIDGRPDTEPTHPRPARTGAELRMTMAMRHLRRSPIEVKAATLPILTPALAMRLLAAQSAKLDDAPLRFGYGTENEPLLKMLQELFREGPLEVQRPIHIGELNRLDDVALQASVVIAPEAMKLPEWSLVALGRAPELYAPARSILHGIKKPDAVAEIASAVSSTPLWPVELSPQAFHSTETSARLVGSLVEIADRCGRFELLLESASTVASDSSADQLLSIYRTLREMWVAPPRQAGNLL